jgi:hypothetical protein
MNIAAAMVLLAARSGRQPASNRQVPVTMRVSSL